MKVNIKDRRMKERVINIKSILSASDVQDFNYLFENCEVFQVFIEPICGGVFGDI